jgi:hypothetical protein
VLNAQTLTAGDRHFKLGETTAVTVGVTEATWDPQGRGLIYVAEDADGRYQGAFRTDKLKGKQVLRLPEGTAITQQQWLAKAPELIEVVQQKLADQRAVRLSILVVDAEDLKAKTVWSMDYKEDAVASVDIDASPLLDHALVHIRDAKGSKPYVLVQGATALIEAPDIVKAEQEGAGFSGWSIDGTAYYSANALTTNGLLENVTTVVADRLFRAQGDGGQTLEFTLTTDGSAVKNVGGLTLAFRVMPTAPAAGVGVFEVMPSNGRLRSVRSKGPYIEKPRDLAPIEERHETARVVSGLRLSSSQALWLIEQPKEQGDDMKPAALLVAPEARQTWMSDDRRWIAWEMGGALFIRQILEGK